MTDEPRESIPATPGGQTEQLGSPGSDEWAALVEAVAADGGILDALNRLLEQAGEQLEEHIQAGPYTENNPAHRLWQTLTETADILHGQRLHLRNAQQALQAPAGNSADHQPAARERGDWVPPSAARETAASLDAISERIDADSPQYIVALLMEPILHTHDGLLVRLARLLASASTYAHRHGAPSEVWQDLGRAGEDLHETAEALDGAPLRLSALPKASGAGASAERAHPQTAPPPTSGNPGRRR